MDRKNLYTDRNKRLFEPVHSVQNHVPATRFFRMKPEGF